MVFEKIFSVLLIIIFALYNVESNGNQNNGFQEVDTDCGPVQGKRFSKKVYDKILWMFVNFVIFLTPKHLWAG